MDELLSRQLPHSTEAEQSVLGSMLIDPKSRPPSPPLAWMMTWMDSSAAARRSASARSAASRSRLAFSWSFMVLRFSAVAGTASFRGRRKLRA